MTPDGGVAGWKNLIFGKLFLTILLLLTASFSFGLGRLSVENTREPVKIEYDATLGQKAPSEARVNSKVQTAAVTNAVTELVPESSEVVASKNGSKYHYLYCSGAKQIKEENKISFPTATAAEASGYTLAANCKPPTN